MGRESGERKTQRERERERKKMSMCVCAWEIERACVCVKKWGSEREGVRDIIAHPSL